MINKNVDKLLQKLKTEFEPEIVPVKIELYSRQLQCYSNVKQKVENDGGKIHYGWRIHQTNLLCEAEHHAVWEDKNEDLLDITPNENNDKEILFVSDNNYTYDGKDVGNIRINATNNFIVDDFILVCETIDKLYSFGERKDELEILLANPIIEFINEYNELKNVLLNFINNNANKFSNCLCGNSKTYKNCHHPILKTKTLGDIKIAEEIYLKLKE